jgi:hypothetical protein
MKFINVSSILALGLSVASASSLFEATNGLQTDPVLDAKRKSLGYSGRALIDKGSFVYDNPAALSLIEKTAFSATVTGSESKTIKGDIIHTDNSFSLPMFSIALPLLRDGGLGFGYIQTKNNSLRLENEEGSTLFKQEGGTTELVASASWSIKKTWALGASFRSLSGQENRRIKYDLSGEYTDDLNLLEDVYVVESNEKLSSDGWYTAFSFQWEERLWGLYLGFQPAYSYDLNVESLQYVSYDSEWAVGITDSDELAYYEVVNPAKRISQEVPSKLSIGGRFNLSPIHMLVSDIAFTPGDDKKYLVQNWNSIQPTSSVARNGWELGLGYQLGGSEKPFDGFLKRSSFRLGYDYSMSSQIDLEQYRFTTGFGFPLGPRGATIDLEGEYGWKENTKGWEEEFVGFTISLTGLGNWGEPSRRYR